MRLFSTLACSAVLLATPVWSWGPEGHKMTATIAQIHLLPSTRRAVCDILPRNASCNLANIATWPDEVRKEPAWSWSAGLHFVNGLDDYPPEKCVFGESGWKEPFDNVLHAIVNTTRDLTNLQGIKQDIALRFLTHYLGDVHQPLHLTGRNFGGNLVPVLYEGKNTSLHRAWDDDLIRYRIRTLTNYTTPLPTSPTPSIPPSQLTRNKHIESSLTGSNFDPLVRWIVLEGINGWWAGEQDGWTQCPQFDLQTGEEQKVMERLPFEDPLDVPVCPYHWAAPSHQMLCDFVWRPEFKGVENSKDAVYKIELETPEYAGHIRDEKMIEKQLALGGIRLASILNAVLGSEDEKREFGVRPRLF